MPRPSSTVGDSIVVFHVIGHTGLLDFDDKALMSGLSPPNGSGEMSVSVWKIVKPVEATALEVFCNSETELFHHADPGRLARD
jgi:hypothetical protein